MARRGIRPAWLRHVSRAGASEILSNQDTTAGRELATFAVELMRNPGMEGYFDRRHFADLKEHLQEAHHCFTTLEGAGILEIISIPSLAENAAGFHISARSEAAGRCVLGSAGQGPTAEPEKRQRTGSRIDGSVLGVHR